MNTIFLKITLFVLNSLRYFILYGKIIWTMLNIRCIFWNIFLLFCVVKEKKQWVWNTHCLNIPNKFTYAVTEKFT